MNDHRREADGAATDPNAAARLSVKQLAVIDRLLLGEDVSSVAKEAGVSRGTIYRWQMTPAFRDELAVRRAAISDLAFDRLCLLVPKAVALMERAIEAEMGKDKPDWRVAAKVLDLVEKSRTPMPTVGVMVAIAEDAADGGGPPADRPRTIEALRTRNLRSWEASGALVGPPLGPGRLAAADGKGAGDE